MTIARLIEGRNFAVVHCTIHTPVREAIAVLAEKRIGAMPVMDGPAVTGIFSERDVLRQLHARGAALLDTPVGDVMVSPAITISPDIGALEALALMTRRRIRHLPVLRDGKMVDFISIGDLVKYRIERIEAEAAAMRDFIQSA